MNSHDRRFDTSLRSPKIITLINIRCEWVLSETRKFFRRVYAKIAFLCAFWNRLGTLRATPCLCRNQETWFTIIDFWAYKRDQAASPFENKRSMMVQKRKVDDIKGQIFEKFSLDAEICDCARAFKSTGESYHFDLPGRKNYETFLQKNHMPRTRLCLATKSLFTIEENRFACRCGWSSSSRVQAGFLISSTFQFVEKKDKHLKEIKKVVKAFCLVLSLATFTHFSSWIFPSETLCCD